MSWHISRMIDSEVLPQGWEEGDQEIVASLGQQLSWGLLFHPRTLRRLISPELKIGRFKPAYER